jgi:hypothetical protein
VQYTNAIFVAGLSDSSNEEQSYIDNEDQYELPKPNSNTRSPIETFSPVVPCGPWLSKF